MRITGGEFRGRILAVPKSGAIRPTQDRVREALFSMLAPECRMPKFLTCLPELAQSGWRRFRVEQGGQRSLKQTVGMSLL